MLVFAAENYERVSNAYRRSQTDLPCSMTCYHDIFCPAIGLFEAMAEGVSKAASVERLASDTNADRIVVFGDSPNDLSMRDVADMFIAPRNAAADVLAVADEIIGSNDDDAVANRILEEF